MKKRERDNYEKERERYEKKGDMRNREREGSDKERDGITFQYYGSKYPCFKLIGSSVLEIHLFKRTNVWENGKSNWLKKQTQLARHT